jgi:hypothetical protein
MKQAIDTFTADMYDPDVRDSLTTQGATTPSKYRFFVGLTDGTEIEWTGLTKKQARDMYAYTNAHHPCNVTGTGWEELK